MVRLLCRVASGVLLLSMPLAAQRPTLYVTGDTAGAPLGCGTAAAAALRDWFAAFSAADSAGLARTTDIGARAWAFSTGKFTPTDTFTRVQTLPALLSYARTRARHHERLVLEKVDFQGWRSGALNALVYFSRSADDLGAAARPGIGKAAYACGRGIFVLNLAPLPRP